MDKLNKIVDKLKKKDSAGKKKFLWAGIQQTFGKKGLTVRVF